MDINEKLYVEIVPMTGDRIPRPHPVQDAGFDTSLIYRVLGMYNASESSECFFILANPRREIWFIPQRHLRAAGIMDSNEMFLPKRRPSDRLAPRAEARPRDKAWRRHDQAGVLGRLRPASVGNDAE